MKIEKSEMENKFILLYRLRCRWKLKSYKKKSVAAETDFPCIYTFQKSEGGEGWGWLSERGRIFEKNIPSNGKMINLIFHGLSYLTRRNFAHCSKLFCFLPH